MIYHAVSTYLTNNAEVNARNLRAQRTWERLYSSGLFAPAHLTAWARSSKDLGDKRDLPYLKDIVTRGFEDSVNDNDIVVVTNADTCFVIEALETLTLKLFDFDCCYSHRREIDKVPKLQFTQEDLLNRAEKSEGVDLFAFKKSWWQGIEFPDFVIGCEGWDWCLKFQIGLTNRVRDCIYHETHQYPTWFSQRKTSIANLRNRKLAMEWVAKRSDKDMIQRVWPGFKEYGKDFKGAI